MSDKKTFTAGPWVWTIDRDAGYELEAHCLEGQNREDVLTYEHEILGYTSERTHICVTRENANLISAAPCLLKELSNLVQLLEPYERDGGLNISGLATLNGARAAIAKATGGAA